MEHIRCLTKNPDLEVTEKCIYHENRNLKKLIDTKGYLSFYDDESRYGTSYIYNLANWVIKVVDPETAQWNDADKYLVKYEYNQYGEKTKEINRLLMVLLLLTAHYTDSNDMVAMMAFTESYNGLGYYLYHKDTISPYAYSGTNAY